MIAFRTWKLSRAEFLKSLALAGMASQLPLLWKCSKPATRSSYALSDKEYGIAQTVQRILFPGDHQVPAAAELNSIKHMQWVLHDKRYDPERKDYLLSGLEWVDETAHETHSKSFLILLEKEKQQLIADIAETGWGEDWLSTMLTLIFEALLLDPVYGVNPQQKGWTWLQHEPGFPRPNDSLKYDRIFKTVAQNGPQI